MPTRQSRCTQPRVDPAVWIDFKEPSNAQENLALSRILALSASDQQLVIGELVALKEFAARGQIAYGDENALKPIRVDPDVYELRWFVCGLHLRQYHGEPPELSDALIELHFHEKDVSSNDDATITNLQNIEISHARLRYVGGRHDLWGASGS
jgi:hypothetical protein